MKNMEKKIIEQIISSDPEKNTDSHVNTREPLVDQTEENVPVNNDVRKSIAYEVALTTCKGIISYFETNSMVEENETKLLSSDDKGNEDHDLSDYWLSQVKQASILNSCLKERDEQKTVANIKSPKQLIDLDRLTPVEIDSFTKLAEVWNDSKI
ncbi:hypothetical protein GA0061073_0780 [Lactobacillus apis]|uniref:hypothetical protein n=2 Tax=Lactobacillus apis TaxID=303541 RepID=UPI000815869B|nr:hypothetical protein [Lactobacillus apis]GGG35833.1 hypothetical protein GCM10007323_07390 [Lactobacillus apis]SCB88496.1 hypothetical protein GA0061073_0780 [Lactobacillus apis]